MSHGSTTMAGARPRRLPRRLVGLLAVLVLMVAACGQSGPNLRETIGAATTILGAANATELGIDPRNIDAAWRATGDTISVANSITAIEAPDERVDHTGGDVFLLYRSGTIWVTPAPTADATAVALYDDNDTAYTRHNVILIGSTRWGSTVNSYRSSGGFGNGFRSGGSGSGK